MKLNELFKNTNYDDSMFSDEAKQFVENEIIIKTVRGKETPYIKCQVRNKDIVLKPEEAVRQLFLYKLTHDYNYPISRIEIEFPIHFGREVKRADIAIMDKNRPMVPYIISPSHLSVCVASLQDIKLFNNNLDVVDDAFEYLMSKAQKGEKGQCFTPRYVIDMCVRMMNPTVKDKIIDTACGSSGFTVHSIFKVWKDIRREKNLPEGEGFTAAQRIPEETNFVRDNVFAIDFDEKTVRVARTLKYEAKATFVFLSITAHRPTKFGFPFVRITTTSPLCKRNDSNSSADIIWQYFCGFSINPFLSSFNLKTG